MKKTVSLHIYFRFQRKSKFSYLNCSFIIFQDLIYNFPKKNNINFFTKLSCFSLFYTKTGPNKHQFRKYYKLLKYKLNLLSGPDDRGPICWEVTIRSQKTTSKRTGVILGNFAYYLGLIFSRNKISRYLDFKKFVSSNFG